MWASVLEEVVLHLGIESDLGMQFLSSFLDSLCSVIVSYDSVTQVGFFEPPFPCLTSDFPLVDRSTPFRSNPIFASRLGS